MGVIKVKTKHREGQVIQYLGNIREIAEAFNVDYLPFRSYTEYENKSYNDIKLLSGVNKELLGGDYVIKENDEVNVIPACEFEEYWEKVQE